MSDYTDLQKAAEYAAQDTIKFADEDEEMRALQQFREEVCPETVLALIAESARLQSAAKTLERLGYRDNGGELWKPPLGQKPDFSLMDQLKAEKKRLESEAVYAAAGFDAAREEIARIKAENAGLKTGYEAYERVNAELKAENECLRKECARLTEDNLALLENPGDAL